MTFTAPDGAVRRFRTRKQMGLLLVLARSAGRPRGREQLVELLWSDDDPRAARHSLAQSISLINKVFGQDAIRFAGKDQVCLREGLVWLDVDEFERAAEAGRHAEARALWRGGLLEGLWVQRAPAFESWLETERQRLTRLYRGVLHAAVEAERTAGNWAAMRDTAESLLETDPLDETAMLGYLEALTLGGDRTLALRRYGEFERRIRSELDAEPGAALRAWIKRHRKGEEQPVPAAVAIPRVAETQALPAARPVYGREEEFKFLWDAWGGAQQGSGSFIILEGPAGIGKSALAGKLANQAHVMGGAVCFVRCWRTEKSVPFAPITALLRQLMRLPGFVALNEVWIGELSRLVPELKERYPAAPAPMAIDDSARHRICDGTLQAAACVADEQPLMIIVDDIQNADEATLALLHYFGRQTGSQAVFLLCVSRSGKPESDVERSFFETARALRVAQFLELAAVRADQAFRIIRAILALRGLDVPEWVYTELHEAGKGNPLQLIESTMALPSRESLDESGWQSALRSHLRHGTESFEESSSSRLSSLSRDAQLVAGILAVAARPLSDYELAAVGAMNASGLLSAVIELERAQFVRRSATHVSFVHDRYQASAQDLLREAEKTRLHLLLAELLAQSAAGDPAARCEVARHFELAGQSRRAYEQALRAAEYAASIGAVRERAHALQLACRVAPATDNDLTLDLGRCLLALKNCSDLRDVCQKVRRTDVPLSDAQRRLLIFLEIAQAHFAGEDSLESTSDRLEALLLNSTVAFPEVYSAHFLLMRVLDKAGEHSKARRAARRLRRFAGQHSEPVANAYRHLGTAWILGKYYSPEKALTYFRLALQEAQAGSILSAEQTCREGLCVMLNNLGRFSEALKEHHLTRLLAQRLLDPLAESLAMNNMAVAEMNLCRWGEAEAHLKEAIDLCSSHPDWALGSLPQQNLGALYMDLWRTEAAEEQLQTAYDRGVRFHFLFLQLIAAGALGVCAARRRDFRQLARWTDRIRSVSSSRVKEIRERSYIEAALAWDKAVNGGNLSGARADIRSAVSSLRASEADHFLNLLFEELLLCEYVSGHRQDGLRDELRIEAAQRRELVDKFEHLLRTSVQAMPVQA